MCFALKNLDAGALNENLGGRGISLLIKKEAELRVRNDSSEYGPRIASRKTSGSSKVRLLISFEKNSRLDALGGLLIFLGKNSSYFEGKSPPFL